MLVMTPTRVAPPLPTLTPVPRGSRSQARSSLRLRAPAARQFVRHLNLHEARVAAPPECKLGPPHARRSTIAHLAPPLSARARCAPHAAQYQSAQLMAAKGVNVPYGIAAKTVAEAVAAAEAKEEAALRAQASVAAEAAAEAAAAQLAASRQQATDVGR